MVSLTRFSQGLRYEEFLETMPPKRRAHFEANYAATQLTYHVLAGLQRVPPGTKCLTLAEQWCHDTGYNLPVLARLAAHHPNIDLRVFPRDENPDLMDLYLTEGKYRSVPVFVFFVPDQVGDGEILREVDRWIERPQVAIAAMQGTTLEERNQMRAENQVSWRAEVAREISELLARASPAE